jgi:hypothetical protein
MAPLLTGTYIIRDDYLMNVRETRGVCYGRQVTANVSLTSAPPPQLSFFWKMSIYFRQEISSFSEPQLLRLESTHTPSAQANSASAGHSVPFMEHEGPLPYSQKQTYVPPHNRLSHEMLTQEFPLPFMKPEASLLYGIEALTGCDAI